VKASADVQDVRNKSDLSDYAGEIRFTIPSRITDSFNSQVPGGGNDPATLVDIPFPIQVPCGATADPAIGASCSTATTFNVIVPGAIKEGDRTLYQFDQVQLFDGGADGDPATGSDSTVFEVQGVFVP
jgi:hypothetical protein